MTAETHNTWDVVLKTFGAIGLITTASIGLIEYYANWNQAAALEANRLDSEQHRLYFDKQLEYYLKVTEIVASIPNTLDKIKRVDLIRQFDVLYYGPMVLLEERGDSADFGQYKPGEKYTKDANVEKHMIAVHRCILTNCPNGDLEIQSLALADACRFALSITWQSRVANLSQSLAFRQRLGLSPDKR